MSRNVAPAVATARASLAAHERWAREPDRVAATAPAREGRWKRYLERAAELHPGAAPEVIERAAEHLRQADMKRMALASARARSAKAKARGRVPDAAA